MAASVKWHGAAEARKAFARLPEVVRTAANRAVDESRKAALAGAKARVPDDTGKLKKSIGSRLDKRRGKASISAKAPHAHLVEYGSVNMPARPFLLQAAEAERSAFEARAHDVGRDVERALEAKR